MKRLPLLLILLSLFLTPSLTLGDEGECIEGDCVNGQGTETYDLVSKKWTPNLSCPLKSLRGLVIKT